MPSRRRGEPPTADKRAAAFESIFGPRMPSKPPPERSASFSPPSARTAFSHAPAYPQTYVYTAVSPTSSTTDLPWQASYAPSTSAAHYAAPSAPHAYSAADTSLASSMSAVSIESPPPPTPARSAPWPTRTLSTSVATHVYPSHDRRPPTRYAPRASMESTESFDEERHRPSDLRTVPSIVSMRRQPSLASTSTPAIESAAALAQPMSPTRTSRTTAPLVRHASGRTVPSTVHPALLSQVAQALEAVLRPRFDGKEAVDRLVELTHVSDRNMVLLLGRALDAQHFLHHAAYTHRLRDSEHELYEFTHDRSQLRGSFSSTHQPTLSLLGADGGALDEARAAYPTGVFTLLTGCYSPTCTRDARCYSITCPYRLERQSQLVVHPSLQHHDSHESLVDISSQLWAESVSSDVYESVSPTERKRQEVIFEIISTERAYVQDLEYLRDLWLTPLSTQHILPEARRAEFVRAVFRNLLDILAVNARLVDMLTRRQRHRSVVEHIGDMYAEVVPDFEPYVYYGAHQAAARLRLEEERAINPVFAMFVEDTERKAVSRKLPVNGFLTKPTARLARYPLLFEQMLKYTADDNMDKIILPKVIRQIKGLLSLVDDETGRSENRLQLGFLSQQLQFKPGELVDLKLGDARRELVFKSALKKRSAQSDSSEIQLYLFDHALLMVKIKVVHKNEVYKVYRRPIPLELLQVTMYEDVATSKGPRTRAVLSRSSFGHRTCLAPGVGSPPLRQDAKSGYALTFTYLGKQGYSLTLWASTLASRDKWIEHIELRQHRLRQQSCVFDLLPVAPRGAPVVVTCAVPFDGGRQVFLGFPDGVYLQDLRDRSRSPTLVLPLRHVLQMDVLEEFQILLVLAEHVVYTFTFDALDPSDPVASMRHGRRIASHTSFFRAGMCLGRTLVCVVKSGAASSTIKTLEPIDVHARAKKHPTFGKMLPSGQDTLRVFKEFYIPTESSSIHFLKSKLCIGTIKGFEIVDLETLDTQGLLDPADASLEFVQRQENLQPIAIFRIDGEFLLCYNEFAFYVNKNGWRARASWLLRWEGTPTAFALHYPYVLAFDPQFVEVRHVETGALHQVITGYQVRCLFSDTAASTLSTLSRLHHARAHKARTLSTVTAPGTPPTAPHAVASLDGYTSSTYASSPPSFVAARPPGPWTASPSPYASPSMPTTPFGYASAAAPPSHVQTPLVDSLLSSRHEILMSGDSAAFLLRPHTPAPP